MDFPQYRKLPNDKVFYKILDSSHFEEIQIVGSKSFHHLIHARQYPEMLRIKDMLDLLEPFVLSSEEEFSRRL